MTEMRDKAAKQPAAANFGFVNRVWRAEDQLWLGSFFACRLLGPDTDSAARSIPRNFNQICQTLL